MTAIRIAGAADAASLARFAEETFRDTFAAVNAVENMTLYCAASYGEEVQLREITDPGRMTLLYEDSGRLLAFAQLAWGEPPGCVAGSLPGEINRFYVMRQQHGRGIAQQLMAACIGEMERRGNDVVWLGVWERNPRAIAFYSRCGFVAVGNQIFKLGNDPQQDIVMVRRLAGAG